MLGAIIAGGASLLGSALGFGSQKKTNKANNKINPVVLFAYLKFVIIKKHNSTIISMVINLYLVPNLF